MLIDCDHGVGRGRLDVGVDEDIRSGVKFDVGGGSGSSGERELKLDVGVDAGSGSELRLDVGVEGVVAVG